MRKPSLAIPNNQGSAMWRVVKDGTSTHRREVRVAREEMPAPSSWEQPLRLRVLSAVSSDSGAKSALHHGQKATSVLSDRAHFMLKA